MEYSFWMIKKNSKIKEFVKELCPDKSEKELSEAVHRLSEYLIIIKDICDRLEREGKGIF